MSLSLLLTIFNQQSDQKSEAFWMNRCVIKKKISFMKLVLLSVKWSNHLYNYFHNNYNFLQMIEDLQYNTNPALKSHVNTSQPACSHSNIIIYALPSIFYRFNLWSVKAQLFDSYYLTHYRTYVSAACRRVLGQNDIAYFTNSDFTQTADFIGLDVYNMKCNKWPKHYSMHLLKVAVISWMWEIYQC